MGGVTGLAGGAVGGIANVAGAGATASGAIGGAAGGAAGAAAGGEDPLKGALIGGALGGVGGAMAPDAGAVSGIKQVGDLTTNPTTSALQSQASGASSPLIQGANTPTSTASMLKGIATPSTATQYANLPASDMSGITQPSSSSYLQKGIDMVKEHPGGAMQVAGLGLGMLGSPQQQQAQQAQTINTTDYLSPDFQRYQATPNYAEGGAVQAPQGPMNPIVARAMAEQQAKMQQPNQPAPMAQPAPMQNIQPAPMQPTPMAQPVPMQPTPQQGIAPQQPVGMASGGIADGYNLGGYAHGGIPRLLSGVGDGVDDQIPATIGADGKQPARLANNEFVIPARAVSQVLFAN